VNRKGLWNQVYLRCGKTTKKGRSTSADKHGKIKGVGGVRRASEGGALGGPEVASDGRAKGEF